MTQRHFGILSSDYLALLADIQRNGNKVPCEWKPEYWFPEDIENPKTRQLATAEAIKGCRACPVQEACFDYALKTNQKHGIWGGSLPSERI
jgi:WhiB family redox-sensing transcriptional regulator